MTPRVWNFSPGPAVLPLPVLEQAQRDLLSLPGLGISILEISHRHKAFDSILAESQTLIRQLLGVPDNYRVLFMQGGAHLQFLTIASNFLQGTGKTAEYILTGTWGNSAVQEARKLGPVRVVWDGKEEKYSSLPAFNQLKFSPDAAYVHFRRTKRSQGVQFIEPARRGPRAAVLRFVERFPLAADRRGALRLDLRLCAEERRDRRRDDGADSR